MYSPRVHIKMCGFERPADVKAACELDLDALGFVFAADARKPLTEALARQLLAACQGAELQRIAVMGRASQDDCRRALALGFDAVQVVVTDWSASSLDGRPVIPVFFDSAVVEQEVERALAGTAPTGAHVGATVCIDGARGGGRGEPPSWPRAAMMARRWPLLLAGGLKPETVANALAAVRPRGVDVSSGIECKPGQKDWVKMANFVAAVRAAQEPFC